MEGSKTIMLLLLSLPIITYGFSKNKNYQQIHQEMPNEVQNIRCEYYSQRCIKKGFDAKNCTGIVQCSKR